MKEQLALRIGAIGMFMLVFLGTSGCAAYVRAPAKYTDHRSRLQVSLPDGWLRYTKAESGYVITRDGLRLEEITILVNRIGKELPDTERVYNAGMLPYEAADLFVDCMKAQEDKSNFEVEKIDTAELAGRDGFRIDATYVDMEGLRKRVRAYGLVTEEHVCILVFDAAYPVYFQRYESVFQEVASSVELNR